jgi:hypothetical protein
MDVDLAESYHREQSSLSFMKKTSQTDEESFSNHGSGSKYLEKEIVPLTFMSM